MCRPIFQPFSRPTWSMLWKRCQPLNGCRTVSSVMECRTANLTKGITRTRWLCVLFSWATSTRRKGPSIAFLYDPPRYRLVHGSKYTASLLWAWFVESRWKRSGERLGTRTSTVLDICSFHPLRETSKPRCTWS